MLIVSHKTSKGNEGKEGTVKDRNDEKIFLSFLSFTASSRKLAFHELCSLLSFFISFYTL